MSNRWWRAYDEAVDDPKVQLLAPPLFKMWFNLMCLASAHGGRLPPIETLCFKLRTTEAKIGAALEELVTRGLLDEFDGVLRPHNWDTRQFKSDVTDPTAAERMRNYRNRYRNGGVTVTVPRDREQNTDTERKKNIEAANAADVQKSKRGRKPSSKVPLPENFEPKKGLSTEERPEFERFCNSARAHDRRYANWDAAWENWKSSPFQGKSNGTLHGRVEKSGLAEAFTEIRQRMGVGPRGTADVGLPKGRLPQPNGVCGDYGGNPGAVRSGDRGVCDGPEDGDSAASEVAAGTGRGR